MGSDTSLLRYTQQSPSNHDIGRAVFRYVSMSHSDLREPFYRKGSTQSFSVDSNKVADSENFKIFKVLKALGFTPNDAQCTSCAFSSHCSVRLDTGTASKGTKR